MKRVALVALSLCFALPHAYAADAAAPAELKTELDKISYALGYDMATNLRENKVELNPQLLSLGITEGYNSGGAQRLSTEEVQQALAKFRQTMQHKRMEALKELSAKNSKEGEAFLAENKKKPGVVVLKDGLQYKVIKNGTGDKPKQSDVVEVHYEGRLVDGKVFDSSYERKKTATFPLNQVIPGWQEAIQLMPVGSNWEVYIPAKLAYGELGFGSFIEPNETLIFKIELISAKAES